MTASDVLCGQGGVQRLIRLAFGPTVTVRSQQDVSGGRGMFSHVVRLEIVGSADLPSSVVAKLPVDNANRHAAASSGAYRREAAAYGHLLPLSPVAHPKLHASVQVGETAAFLLEDLTRLRRVDQLMGLGPAEAGAVADALGRLHRFWHIRAGTPGNPLDKLGIRRSAVAGFPLDSLARGLSAVRERWEMPSPDETGAFAALLDNAPALIEAFTATASRHPTLCHGDPRADNLCFADDGSAVLFDWQQIAVQFAEADVAWLMATSLEPDVRRNCTAEILDRLELDADRYRLGLVLPGLAALLLAQREADSDRTRRFVAASLSRIAKAIADHDVATAAR